MNPGTAVCPLPVRSTEPSFGAAMDAGLVRDLVQRHLAEDAEVVSLRPDYVRWKDADGSLVGYRVELRRGDDAVRSYVTVRTAPADRLAAEADRLRHRAHEAHGHLRGLALAEPPGLLLLAYPLDRAMPDLRRVVRASKVRSLIAANCPGLVPEGLRFSKSRSRFELVRYKPERRAVLKWRVALVDEQGTGDCGVTVWIRAYAEPQATRTAAAIRAAARAGVRCPQPLGSAHERLAIESHLDGTACASVRDPAHATAVAATLARLHAAPAPSELQFHGPVQELDRALRAADDLVRLLPSLRSRTVALTDWLTAHVPPTGQPVFSHGDLHAGQVLLHAGDAGFCDFDRAMLSSPAADLASLLAHEVLADPVRGAEAAQGTIAAYRRHVRLPDRGTLEWWCTSALLRAATVPFRALRRDWPVASTGLLTAAEATRVGASVLEEGA